MVPVATPRGCAAFRLECFVLCQMMFPIRIYNRHKMKPEDSPTYKMSY